jgi:hypothetical protein
MAPTRSSKNGPPLDHPHQVPVDGDPTYAADTILDCRYTTLTVSISPDSLRRARTKSAAKD